MRSESSLRLTPRAVAAALWLSVAASAPLHAQNARAGVTRAPFGALPDGRKAELFTLTNAHGVEVRVTNYGAIVTTVRTPDRAGRFDDIVLGYDSLAGYLRATPY